jgi:sugar transferase (PEP-CTERM/EpsH1 system associated)
MGRPVTARPTIVHAIHSLATGGLENGVVNLANHSGLAFRHVVVCMSTDGALGRSLNPDVTVMALGKRPGQDLWAFARLVGLLRRLRPAVVHSRNWAAFDAVPAARLAGVPVVVHGEHGRDIANPEGRNRRRNRIRRALAPLVTSFVTVSFDLRRWLVEDVGIRAGKVTAIHNGVDASRFGHVDRRYARDVLGLPADAPIVGTVGRLDPVKDQAGLLRAFAAARGGHPDSILVIAGDGPCRAELEDLVGALGLGAQVRFLGERKDIPVVLAAMDLFALPSIAEGMSNTVLEAMASALPVVATRVGGSPEMVEDGVNGRLVPRQDPNALRAAIADYLGDGHLRHLHGKASRERVLEHFTLERMCGDYTGLYRRLLGVRAGGGG